MVGRCLAAVAILWAASAQAKLELRDIKATYGFLGPERKDLIYYPGDEVFFRFVVAGFKTDAEGKIHGALSVRFLDEQGGQHYKSTSPLNAVVALGGETVPGTAFISVADDFPPGRYTLEVTFTDQLANQSAGFRREVRFKPTEFALVALRFFHDAEGKVPAPAGGVVGQALYLRFFVIGFAYKEGLPAVAITLQILDKAGKETMPRPITFDFHEAPDIPRDAKRLILKPYINLNRAGDFTLRITMEDQVTRKTIRLEQPLHVADW
ncbi:MAG: hypothetical protein IRY99_16045 [Isosphaeraceae bacterium]|nr:hypothetical protein [Isosphaeraceae bacterium]